MASAKSSARSTSAGSWFVVAPKMRWVSTPNYRIKIFRFAGARMGGGCWRTHRAPCGTASVIRNGRIGVTYSKSKTMCSICSSLPASQRRFLIATPHLPVARQYRRCGATACGCRAPITRFRRRQLTPLPNCAAAAFPVMSLHSTVVLHGRCARGSRLSGTRVDLTTRRKHWPRCARSISKFVFGNIRMCRFTTRCLRNLRPRAGC